MTSFKYLRRDHLQKFNLITGTNEHTGNIIGKRVPIIGIKICK